MTISEEQPEALAWSQARVRERFGDDAMVTDAQSVSSRLASLYRLTIASPRERRICYLKKYEPAGRVTATEHVEHLEAAAAAIMGAPELLPCLVLASDGARGLLLLSEVPGQSLASLHRAAILSPGARDMAVAAWHGVGRWLARLHGTALPPTLSRTLPAELAEYTQVRLRDWGREDAACAPLAEQASRAVDRAARQLQDRGAATTLCHGDVSSGNIMVEGTAVGLIDMDDLHVGMPAVDLSQAILEIGEFARIASAIALPRLRARSMAAFREGYGRPLPEGPVFWLPHVRNLAVFAITLARARKDGDRSAVWRYRRTIAELRRVTALVSP